MTPDQKNSFEFYLQETREIEIYDPASNIYKESILSVLELDNDIFYVSHFSHFEIHISDKYNSSFSLRLSFFDELNIHIYIMDSISGNDEMELFLMKKELYKNLNSTFLNFLKNIPLLDSIKRSNFIEHDMEGSIKQKLQKNYEDYLINKELETSFEKPSEIYSKYSLNYSLSLYYDKKNIDCFDFYNKAYILKKHGVLIHSNDYLFIKKLFKESSMVSSDIFSKIVLQEEDNESKYLKLINEILEFNDNRLTEHSKELLTINLKV